MTNKGGFGFYKAKGIFGTRLNGIIKREKTPVFDRVQEFFEYNRDLEAYFLQPLLDLWLRLLGFAAFDSEALQYYCIRIVTA